MLVSFLRQLFEGIHTFSSLQLRHALGALCLILLVFESTRLECVTPTLPLLSLLPMLLLVASIFNNYGY